MTLTDMSTYSADDLHRGVKMAMDTGEAASLDEALAIFSRYRLAVAIDAATAASPAGQAALLTIVNCGRRALLGGIAVAGPLDTPLLLDVPGCGTTLREAITALGGELVEYLPTDRSTLILGVTPENVPEPALSVVFGGWRTGVVPTDEQRAFADDPDDILSGIVAGAIGVSEMFQNLRGNPMAGRRRIGISLWDPAERDWEQAKPGPKDFVAPTCLWLIGLGHLGQAVLWTLALLPYAQPEEVELTLQDFDTLTKANDSTSVLTTLKLVGEAKTRAMAHWAEARGFRTRMVERRFAGDVSLQFDDPRVALCGVDNPAARAVLEDCGFDLVVEAGLGAGSQEYCAMRIHSFPGEAKARDLWSEEGAEAASNSSEKPAYQQMHEDGLDECGLVTIASRTVGAPFVGTVAAGLVVAEVLRRLNGGSAFDVIDLNLRDLRSRELVPATPRHACFNPGFAELRLRR